MKARELMSSHPAVVTEEKKVSDAARIMRDRNVGAVPVVRTVAGMEPVGIITDRDIVIRCVAERHQEDCDVVDHMSTGQLDSVSADADIEEVMALMERDQLRRILVTDGGRLVGIIAQADLALKEGPIEPLKVEEVLERISAPSVQLM